MFLCNSRASHSWFPHDFTCLSYLLLFLQIVPTGHFPSCFFTCLLLSRLYTQSGMVSNSIGNISSWQQDKILV